MAECRQAGRQEAARVSERQPGVRELQERERERQRQRERERETERGMG
jgi:hypothetical protein